MNEKDVANLIGYLQEILETLNGIESLLERLVDGVEEE